MKIKRGHMILYETPTGEVHFARVEAEVAPRRYRILVTPDAFRLEVPAGDIALPGEDADNAAREASARAWAARESGESNGMGGYRTPALNPRQDEEGDANEGRH